MLLRLHPSPEAPAPLDAPLAREPLLAPAHVRAPLRARMPPGPVPALPGDDAAHVPLRQADGFPPVLPHVPAPAPLSSTADAARVDLSCGRACEKRLVCGNHVCAEPCHPGACPPCAVTEAVRCWCGTVEKRLACGEGEKKVCAVVRGDGEEEEEKQRVRSFDCGNSCDRYVLPPSTPDFD